MDHPARLVAGLEAFVALGAWGGVFGFLAGHFDPLVAQLPWHSALLGAVALAAFVAVPTTLATVALLRGWHRADRVALATAVVLAGWLLGQILVVGFSAFQPVYLLIAGFIAGLAPELRRKETG